MRAIETRKDIVINTNLGYCGVINAKGEIVEKSMHSWPTIINATIEKNDNKSTNENRKIIFYIMAMAFIVVGIKLKYKRTKN
jgi:apolipoprotein N-acyltransferase